MFRFSCRHRHLAIVAAVAALIGTGQWVSAQVSFSTVKVTGKGPAKVESSGETVRLKIDDPRNDAGVSLTPRDNANSWDLSKWDVLAVDVENVSTDIQARLLMSVTAEVTNPSDKKEPKEANVGIAVNPGEKRTIRLRLPHRWKYGHPVGVPGVRAIDTTKVLQIDFFMQWPFERPRSGLADLKLSNLRVEGSLTPASPPTAEQYIPFIDEYGQFIHGNWAAKILSPADLRKNYEKEKAELSRSTRPDQWNRFGGWKNGPQLEATGHFRTAKHEGRWYLVDPEGRLFISHGLDVLSNYNDPLKVMPGKENWFKDLPQGATTYQPTEVALSQKYGVSVGSGDYRKEYYSTLSKRLEHWGFNSLGDWSQTSLIEQGRTPYTLQLTDYDWKMPRLAASKVKFYDVFDPAYIDKMKNLISWASARDPIVTKSLTDPMCIGYWIDNELDFGNRSPGGGVNLINDLLKCPAKQAAKKEFVSDLKAKYSTIAALNTAWGTSHADFDALLNATDVVPTTEAYRVDARLFHEKMVDQYFRLSRDAIKRVAPHRLYLGARFISTDAVRPVLYKASEKYCDVLSVNIYAHSAANFPSHVTDSSFPDMPVIIGEFHFGVLDRGMFSASLCNAGLTQEDRAEAYVRFMQGVLVHPNFVGAHWFQYRDQPLTGRGDGEAYQIGFVDVADTPYEELCRAARKVGEGMYRYRSQGKLTAEMTP